jgi:predicted ester cyclase
MSVEGNREVVRRFTDEAWGRGNLAVAEELLSPDLNNHRTRPGQPHGREGMLETLRQFHEAFGVRRFIPERLIAQRNEVADSWEMIAFHQGDFYGNPGTGQLVTLSGADWYQVSDGQIVEIWHEQDVFGVLVELGGALP